jgi:uncharacterized protein
VPYVDTSVLGSYYCPERLSHVVGPVMAALSEAVISPIVEVEFCSLLSLKVRARTLTHSAASAALGQFRVHLADRRYTLVEIGSRECELARDWLSTFNTPLRTLDALHLAAAFANRQTILTTDKALANAAEALRVPFQLLRG